MIQYRSGQTISMVLPTREKRENMFNLPNKQGNSDQYYSNVDFITRLARSLKPDNTKNQLQCTVGV